LTCAFIHQVGLGGVHGLGYHRLLAGQAVPKRSRQGVEVAVDVVEDHRLLGREVREERARCDLRGSRYVGDRRGLIAALREQAHGRVDDLLAGALLLALSQSLWHVLIVANLHAV